MLHSRAERWADWTISGPGNNAPLLNGIHSVFSPVWRHPNCPVSHHSCRRQRPFSSASPYGPASQRSSCQKHAPTPTPPLFSSAPSFGHHSFAHQNHANGTQMSPRGTCHRTVATSRLFSVLLCLSCDDDSSKDTPASPLVLPCPAAAVCLTLTGPYASARDPDLSFWDPTKGSYL